MRTLYILIAVCLLGVHPLMAQQRFPSSGTITFEKTLNVHAYINKRLKERPNEGFSKQLYESYKNANPQFKRLYSKLLFSGNHTLFTPLPDAGAQDFMSGSIGIYQANTIYTDLGTGLSTCQKEVYGDKLLIRDTARVIQWKITSETREIAGYQCRRANAIIMDSIYVVAFYTDQIHVSGGPESFTGLPGMILGVALPHDNVTWFATSIDLTSVPATSMVTPKKGKEMKTLEMREKIKTVWGDNIGGLMWWLEL
ncbi:GLPGLI family protein [Chitinophaga sancti]|uniref:GLPGLI family protein n=1 Tax=Chitinophaga sancti TaxID=1004 RepID=A0A1K1SN89_9BACT|nr:GLPGLI family protein [Chitinophaga sancti]WQD60082.1 GLPGLI family protein [Chitinophaga sancti]WQG87790.1 GLPGLI family protein [Chitinophaga sancti]SFW85684.1 GLPGLI family protein [Chitinophaga sancti]